MTRRSAVGSRGREEDARLRTSGDEGEVRHTRHSGDRDVTEAFRRRRPWSIDLLPGTTGPNERETGMQIKYLIVEDNEEYRNRLANELSGAATSTAVLFADDGDKALQKLRQEPDIDIVVLDLTLNTDMYGLEVLDRIREFSDVLVVILTSEQSPYQHTEAIKRGADGYMDKGAFAETIQARHHLETIFRRHRVSRRVSFDGWTVDTLRRTLFNPDGVEIVLSAREFDMLLLFVDNPQTLLTPDDLIDKLGARGARDPQAALARLLSRLRKKIYDDRREPFIRNVYSRGFIFMPTIEPVEKP